MEKKTFSRSEQIKALTHPLRLRLMDLLRSGRELTATEAAELTGESVASCSFHLRQLAKFGVVEQAERRGREKPWKARDITLVLDAEGGDREDLVSAMAGARALLQQS
ncbi:winged helix-turn-helix domain-containing protein, partial [Bacillus sp. SIMBA_161]